MFKTLMMAAAIALTAPLAASAATINIVKNGFYSGGEPTLASGSSVSFGFEALEDLRVLNFVSITGNGTNSGNDLTKVSYGINGVMETFTYTGTSATAAAAVQLPGFKLLAGDTFTIDFEYAQGGARTVDVDYSFVTAPVPVPAAGLMLLSGLGGLAIARRRARTA